ncbi:isoform A [Micractinium conductrix]|uniref:Isoform A n=1 Tax=Micractinium conductrix TaxID=554055 RepID=A0A2P6V8F9_9CHLO|nr:isoform A [Micractinium conductrix]|eukprot:PSC70363.1 isoform A [Micractinium conductrix]
MVLRPTQTKEEWLNHSQAKPYLVNTCKDSRFDLFKEPVDESQFPDYRDVVTTPMDMATMLGKSHRKEYKDPKHLLEDFALIVANAEAFNGKDSYVHKAAVLMWDDVNKESSALNQEKLADKWSKAIIDEGQMAARKAGVRKA